MTTKLMTLRIDEDLKEDFDSFCSDVGLTTTSAILMFVKATLRERRIPFEISADPFYSLSNTRALTNSMAELAEGDYTDVSLEEFDSFVESL